MNGRNACDRPVGSRATNSPRERAGKTFGWRSDDPRRTESIRMRATLPDKLEAGRVQGRREWGAYGAWTVQGPCGEKLNIVASGAADDDLEAAGWEHVSVSTRRRVPNWT